MWKKLALAVPLSLLVGPTADAAATPAHWRREAHPLVITVYDQTADALWGHALHALTEEWNAGIEGIAFVMSMAPANCATGAGVFTVVVCVRENRAAGHMGETTVYSRDGHITRVITWMDPRTNPPRRHLACHELGHALGVQHRSGETTCMTNDVGSFPEHPDQRDFDGVSAAYAHRH